MQGGTAATQDVFIEHAGIPTLPAVRMAAEALRDIGMSDQVQLVVSGGIRSGADVAKALALGADAVSIGVAVPPSTSAPTTPRWAPGRVPARTATRARVPSASPRRTPRSKRGSIPSTPP